MRDVRLNKTKKMELATTSTSVKSFFEQDAIQKKFTALLGSKAQGFITSILQVCAGNNLFQTADHVSIYNAALMAATLDLPINQNLGFAYIIPYNQKQADGSFKNVAQFQMGYRGFIQLAQRSGAFKTISASPIYEGQLIESNPLTGFVFDFSKKKSDIIIGFAAYFRLLNGFEKTLYMDVNEMQNHGQKFSKTYKNSNSLWKTDLVGMGTKTVIKMLLSKYALLSVEMQKAVMVDQALINDEKGEQVTYVDNEEVVINKEAERKVLMLQDCKTIEQVERLQEQYPNWDVKLFEDRKNELQIIEIQTTKKQ